MPNPLEVLKKLHTLLRPGHIVLIRIPVADSYAWQAYGVNWMNLDAPRHLYLHTCKSMGFLARETGFKIREVVYDSNAEQFMGSEQYQRDIPLNDERSFERDLANSIFSDQQINKFRQKASQLNRQSDGDQACFYLVRE